MLVHIVRAFYLLVVIAITTSYAFQEQVYSEGQAYITGYILIPTIAAFLLVMIDMFWRRKQLQVMAGLFFGLAAGLVIAYAATQVVDMVGRVFMPSQQIVKPSAEPAKSSVKLTAQATSMPESDKIALKITGDQEKPSKDSNAEPTSITTAHQNVLELIKMLLGVSLVFMCVSFVLQTRDDFRFIIPYVEFAHEVKGARPLLLDTSTIIDGRIADLIETRIIDSPLIVPRFVLGELQMIADSADKLKRNRGRRGLDILNRLQTSDKASIKILDSHASSVEQVKDVDGKLVALAEHMRARIITNDYNLNKVAQLRGVETINVNDIAGALKPVVLPGEPMTVRIIRSGEEPGQGVGYLPDGTMVVAENARELIGKDVKISVTSVLQTSAGRMIFGRAEPEKSA